MEIQVSIIPQSRLEDSLPSTSQNLDLYDSNSNDKDETNESIVQFGDEEIIFSSSSEYKETNYPLYISKEMQSFAEATIQPKSFTNEQYESRMICNGKYLLIHVKPEKTLGMEQISIQTEYIGLGMNVLNIIHSEYQSKKLGMSANEITNLKGKDLLQKFMSSELIHDFEHFFSERGVKDLNLVKNGSTEDSKVSSMRSLVIPVRGEKNSERSIEGMGSISNIDAIEATRILYNQIRSLLTHQEITLERTKESVYAVHHEFMNNFQSQQFVIDAVVKDMLRRRECQIQLRPDRLPKDYDFDSLLLSLHLILDSIHLHPATIKVISSAPTEEILRIIEEAEKMYGHPKKPFDRRQSKKIHHKLESEPPIAVFCPEMLDNVVTRPFFSTNQKYNFIVAIELKDKFRSFDCYLNPGAYILKCLKEQQYCYDYCIDSNFYSTNIHAGEFYCIYFSRKVSPLASKKYLRNELLKLKKATLVALKQSQDIKNIEKPSNGYCSCFNQSRHDLFHDVISPKDIIAAILGRIVDIRGGSNNNDFRTYGMFFEFDAKKTHDIKLFNRYMEKSEDIKEIEKILRDTEIDKAFCEFSSAKINEECVEPKQNLTEKDLLQLILSFIASNDFSHMEDVVSTSLQFDKQITNNDALVIILSANPYIFANFLRESNKITISWEMGSLKHVPLRKLDSIFKIKDDFDDIGYRSEAFMTQVLQLPNMTYNSSGFLGSSCSITFNIEVNQCYRRFISLLQFPIFRIAREIYRVQHKLGYDIIVAPDNFDAQSSINIFFDCPHYLYKEALITSTSIINLINNIFRTRSKSFLHAYLSSFYQYEYDCNEVNFDQTANDFEYHYVDSDKAINLRKDFLMMLQSSDDIDIFNMNTMKCISLISYLVL